MTKANQSVARKSEWELRTRRVKILDRLSLFWSTSRLVDGLWVGADESSNATPVLNRVEEALCLIKTHDPGRYARVLRDLDRVWIRLLPGALGRFNKALRTCELDTRFVLDEATSSELIAATIVHEATHARLLHRGIGYEEEMRGRVERVCVRRELAFAAKLPSGQEIRDRGEPKFTLPREIWSDADTDQRDVGDAVEITRRLGAPDWFPRAVLTFRLMKKAATHGRAHPETMRLIDGLAHLQQAQGDLAGARSSFERALAIREKTFGPEHADTARSYSNLGLVLRAQGDLAGARPLLEHTLAIYEKALGPDHANTATSRSCPSAWCKWR